VLLWRSSDFPGCITLSSRGFLTLSLASTEIQGQCGLSGILHGYAREMLARMKNGSRQAKQNSEREQEITADILLRTESSRYCRASIGEFSLLLSFSFYIRSFRPSSPTTICLHADVRGRM
jgi:hypothetical protein